MSTHGKFKEVEFDRIVVGEEFENYREMYSDEDIDDQSMSLQEVGLLQNLIVRERRGENNKIVYDLIAGFRRYFAIKKLRDGDAKRFHKVPVRIIKTKDEKSLLLIGITENLKRKDHTSAELAAALVKLENMGMKRSDIARKLNRQPSWVSDILNTNEMAEPELKQVNAIGAISNSKYRKGARLNKGNQQKVAKKARTLSKNKKKPKREKGREIDKTIKEAQRSEGKDSGFRVYRRKDECQQMAQEMFNEINEATLVPDDTDDVQRVASEYGYKTGILAAMAWFLDADSIADMDLLDIRDYLEGKGLTLRPQEKVEEFDEEPEEEDLALIEEPSEDDLAAIGADFEDDD